MKNEHRKESRLSSLYAQRSKLNQKIVKLNKEKERIESEIKTADDKLAGINRGISYFHNRDILITSHFMARYIQRIGPATEDEMREHIITPQLINMINVLGNGTYPVDKYMVRIEDNKLITIMHQEKTKKKG